MPALLRHAARCLAGAAAAAILGGAAPRYEGIWSLEADESVGVSFPAADVPGATIRVANGAGTARVSTAFDDNPFDGVRLTARTALDPLLVHAELRIDGERVAAFEAPGVVEADVDVPVAGDVFTLVVETGAEPPKGWSIELVGITFRRGGYDVLYSHDCAGLDVRLEDGVRFAVDRDWAELGWPLAGSVGVARARPEGAERLAYTLRPSLPAGLFRLRVGVDGEPLALYLPDDEAPVSATFPLAGGAREVQLSMAVMSPVQGDAAWQASFGELHFDAPAAAPPAAASGGCSAGPQGALAAPWLLLSLLLLARRPS